MTSLAVGTVTYAAKGKDILTKNGIKTTIKRADSKTALLGCGYLLVINDNPAKAIKLLNAEGIKVLEVKKI